MYPIWKDKDVTKAASSSESNWPFVIWNMGASPNVALYKGVAYANGVDGYSVRVNDILADYLYNDIPTTFSSTVALAAVNAPNYLLNVALKDNDTTGTSRWAESALAYDWSYDNSAPANVKSDPINCRIDPRMPLIWTSYYTAAHSVQITGYAVSGDFYVGDYNNDYSGASTQQAYTYSQAANSVYNICFPPEGVQLYNWIVRADDSKTFKVVRACHRYALYYINAYGGIDFLLLEGNCEVEDALTRSTIKKFYNNTNAYARGKYEYLNEQVRNYTLRTGLLTEAESLRMHHLLESPQVCLWDNTEGVMHPVVLTNSSCEFKTYRSNGNKLVQYTINAELARDRQRR